MPETKEAQVYIKHPEYAWIPARLDKTEGDKAYVSVPQYKDQQAIGCVPAKKFEEKVVNLKDSPHKVLPLQNVDANGNLVVHPDMIHLSYLHEVRERDECWSLLWVRLVVPSLTEACSFV